MQRQPLPDWDVLHAPQHWRTVEFISDLHLQDSEPATLAALEQYLQRSRADALFVLGDLFEVWLGDDCLAGEAPARFEHRVRDLLRAASAQRPVFFMPGNRDFLLGQAGCSACGMALLADPTVLHFANQRWLLTHGDALCLDDTSYMAFRQQVRSAQWQQQFLQQSLAEREAQARAIRQHSEAHKQETGYADVDGPEVERWLDAAPAFAMIHGHTHRAADHPAGGTRLRHVLSDWDAHATPARSQVLQLQHTASGAQVRRWSPLETVAAGGGEDVRPAT